MEQSFFGSDLPLNLLEVKGIKIDPELRVGEATLMRKRWFDYRGMHPVLATYLYAHHYEQQVARFYETVVDIRTVEKVRPFAHPDVMTTNDAVPLWNARRAADELSIPYPFVMHFAQQRSLDRLYSTFPRPNQLYNEEFLADLAEAWQVRLKSQITTASDARYRMSQWRGDLDQAAHIRFVVEQIKARPAPRYRLLGRMIGEDILNASMVAVHFGQEEAARAEQWSSQFNQQ